MLPKANHTIHVTLIRSLAGAVMFAAICGGAAAQVTVPVEITIGPTSSPPPFPADGACAKQGGFIICVSPDPVDMGSAPGNKDNSIVWTVSTGGWTFAKKGIDIKNRKTWQLKRDSPTQYTATNKRDGDQYKYDINVTNGTVTVSWDPSIMN
jgi:hypothetical protein